MPSAVPKPGESLADLFPDVAAEWHPTKNGDLTPADRTAGSSKKVWWKCPVADDHEWSTVINNRTNRGDGCPCCSGRQVSITNSLQSLFPEVAAQWHPTNNGDRRPTDVVAGSSSKKVWWKCPKGDDHEWPAKPNERTFGGNGCPHCAGYESSVTNRLDIQFPDVAAQWHPTKNNDLRHTRGSRKGEPLRPDNVVASSQTVVWWKCPVGDDHVWDTTPMHRTNLGQGCPCCAGQQLSVTNSLQTLFPEIAAEWHPTKNGGVTPVDIYVHSRQKVWWKCPVGDDHVWDATPANRTYNQSGCPCCSGHQLSVTNRLDIQFPDVAAQWHPTKNNDLRHTMGRFKGEPLRSDKLVEGSKEKVWWKCPVADDHEWIAPVVGLTRRREGCPCCAGKQLSVTNRLDTQFPEIAAQWHPTKNGGVTPADVVAGTPTKYWWRCPVADYHEWQSGPHSRTRRGDGCPHCTLTPRSAQEIRLAHELSALIDFDLEVHKVRFAGRLRDVDIVLDALKVVVEFDGAYWHRNKVDKDRDKTALMEEAGWQVIRVRERPLDSIHANDVMVDTLAPAKTVADLVLNKIVGVTGTDVPQLDEYLASEGPWREAQALKAIRAYQAERAAKKAARANKAE